MEYAVSLGMASWQDSLRPCWDCNCQQATMHDSRYFNAHPSGVFRDNETADYDLSCTRCELVAVLNFGARDQVAAHLCWDKRTDGNKGRCLKADLPELGLVQGSTIRAKHVGRDIMAGLKNIVGGELKGYTELMKEARQQATDRMIEQATQLGANAAVNVRFSTSSVAQGASEMLAYGTAVKCD